VICSHNKNQKKRITDMNKETNMIPESVLTTLTEFTCGGFILFTIDAEGCPRVVFNFENLASALALQSHMRYSAAAFEHINRESAYRAITQEPPEGEN
jgi:hypothetical protein